MIYMVNHKKNRFYWLETTQDIFGCWCVHKVFGGLFSRKAREQWQTCSSKLEASQAMFDIEVLTRNRGYVYADNPVIEYFALTPELIES